MKYKELSNLNLNCLNRKYKKDSVENFIKYIFALKNFLKAKCAEILVSYSYFNKFLNQYILFDYVTLTYEFNSFRNFPNFYL